LTFHPIRNFPRIIEDPPLGLRPDAVAYLLGAEGDPVTFSFFFSHAMPKRKRSTKARKGSLKKRRLFGRRYRLRRGRRVNVVRGRGPVAQTTIARLKYNGIFSNTSPLLGVKWSINSIYDPDVSALGHQPYGHDTYQTLYNRYRVNKVSYRIQIYSTTTAPIKYTVLANNTDDNFSSYDLAAELPNARTKIGAAYMGGVVFTGYYVPRLVTGVGRAEYKDDKYSAQFGASPTEIMRLHILGGYLDNSVPATGVWSGNITLVYHVEMWDPKDLAQS